MAWSTRRGMGARPRSALHSCFDVASSMTHLCLVPKGVAAWLCELSEKEGLGSPACPGRLCSAWRPADGVVNLKCRCCASEAPFCIMHQARGWHAGCWQSSIGMVVAILKEKKGEDLEERSYVVLAVVTASEVG